MVDDTNVTCCVGVFWHAVWKRRSFGVTVIFDCQLRSYEGETKEKFQFQNRIEAHQVLRNMLEDAHVTGGTSGVDHFLK